MAQNASSRRAQLKDEAAAWVVRLDSGANPDERAAFEAWRGSSPEHEVAFERESATWARLDRLQALRPAEAAPDADLLARAPLVVNDDDQDYQPRTWRL